MLYQLRKWQLAMNSTDLYLCVPLCIQYVTWYGPWRRACGFNSFHRMAFIELIEIKWWFIDMMRYWMMCHDYGFPFSPHIYTWLIWSKHNYFVNKWVWFLFETKFLKTNCHTYCQHFSKSVNYFDRRYGFNFGMGKFSYPHLKILRDAPLAIQGEGKYKVF